MSENYERLRFRKRLFSAVFDCTYAVCHASRHHCQYSTEIIQRGKLDVQPLCQSAPTEKCNSKNAHFVGLTHASSRDKHNLMCI